MKTFLRRSPVKAVMALLCILSLVLGACCGAGLLAVLLHNGFYGPETMFASMAGNTLRGDADRIMHEYFDPDDPTHPWISYYSGGIYTGLNSNFIYRITDQDTGDTVLSTYTGAPAVQLSRSYTYQFDEQVAETEPAEPTEVQQEEAYTVSGAVFECADEIYAYDRVSGVFQPVEDSIYGYLAVSDEPLPQLSSYALVEGFRYGSVHYTYDGSIFYPDYTLEETYYTYRLHTYTLDCYLLADLPHQDNYRAMYNVAYSLSDHWYDLSWFCAASLALGLALLLILCLTIDRVPGSDELRLNPLYRLPTDLALALVAFCALVGLEIAVRLTPERARMELICLLDGLILAGFTVLGVYTAVMLCARGKKGILFSGTVLNWFVKNLGRLGGRASQVLSYVPLMWKVLAGYGLICLAEFFVLMATDAYGETVLLWLIGRLFCGVIVGYIALALLRLKTGAERIAAGDYDTQVEEKNLVLDFKDTAQTLNHIRDGMNAAVDSRLRSERMKTELITNVSHDLKTPLTSIVSYVDLLRQELDRTAAVSRTAEEYLQVLDRQSMRLKKLIEDLVEASKASSGTLTLHMESLDFRQLLGQALGEYAQKLTQADLTLMTKLPEEPVMVQADGRQLWRVFDNLLGNAVKYAMPGTRLYLNVVTGEGAVTATFRNISKEPLDVSAEELMERFVQGDPARHSEGSGLGLSIARSLTESMGGQFQVSLDGDLFKAEVRLPVLPALPRQTA